MKRVRDRCPCRFTCVCVARRALRRRPGSSSAGPRPRALRRPGLQPLTGPRGPAGGRRNSRELPPARSRDRFCSQPCTSGAATAYCSGLGAPRPLLPPFAGAASPLLFTPYAIAAAENFDAVANAHSNHDCWRAVCRLRCSVGSCLAGLFRETIAAWCERGVRAYAYKHPRGAQDSVGSNPPLERDASTVRRDHAKRGVFPPSPSTSNRTHTREKQKRNIINYSGAKTAQVVASSSLGRSPSAAAPCRATPLRAPPRPATPAPGSPRA